MGRRSTKPGGKARPVPSSEVLAIAESPGSPRLRRALTFVGGCYVVAMFLEGVQPWLHRYLPQSLVFFCQISALFPRAASHSIEYRAQGYTCSDKVIEIDVRPFFPIHADDKESRFERAMFFYRNDKTVMEALEAYVMREYNRAEPDKIAGVSFMSLRLPIPPPGTTFPRYERKALVDYPSERRKVWYFTPHDTVALRCRSGGL